MSNPYAECAVRDLEPFLAANHYLGPFKTGRVILAAAQLDGDEVVAAMVWKLPSSRRLPSDGSWADLSRWCLTPRAGANAGSRMNAWALRRLRAEGVDTGVTYADPSVGHDGTLYRACGYQWAPVWHELRPPPTGLGSWHNGVRAEPKRRYALHLRRHDRLRRALLLDDRGAVRAWRSRVTEEQAAREARLSLYVSYGLGLL